MKEATGELNMTVITLVAVAAVGALFYFVIWPVIQRMVVNQTCSSYGEYTAVKVKGENAAGYCTSLENDKTDCWACCPKPSGNEKATFNSSKCIVAD